MTRSQPVADDSFWDEYEYHLRSEFRRAWYSSIHRVSTWLRAPISISYSSDGGPAGLWSVAGRTAVDPTGLRPVWTASQGWIDRCAALDREPDILGWSEAAGVLDRWSDIVEQVTARGLTSDAGVPTSPDRTMFMLFTRAGTKSTVSCFEVSRDTATKAEAALGRIRVSEPSDLLPNYLSALRDPRQPLPRRR
jgi:hypothetical protein